MTRLLERASDLSIIRRVIRRGGVLVVEGRAGLGKTVLLDAACAAAERNGQRVLRARGAALESEFAFGIARQLFERLCAQASRDDRAALFAGAAGAAKGLLTRGVAARPGDDSSFGVVHGLFWLTANLAAQQRLLLAIDDAQWGDDTSLRWLAYLAARLDGVDATLVMTLRPDEARSRSPSMTALRGAAGATVRPRLLSEQAVATLVGRALGSAMRGDLGAGVHRATGGNPFYVLELLRALKRAGGEGGVHEIERAIGGGGIDGVAMQLGARLRSLDPAALRLAQAIAILGDGSELRHAAAIAHMTMDRAVPLATELVQSDVLGEDRPPRFIHPIVHHAMMRTLSSAEQDAAHRAAARLLHAARSPSGRIATHVMRLRLAGDPWVVERLREAARDALASGAPALAADLLERALLEPPEPRVRVAVLREAARAQLAAGRALACQRLEEAQAIAEPGMRAELAAELARTYATLFRWADAVHVLERAVASLGRSRQALAPYLESALVAAGLQEAQVAPRAVQVMKRLSRRRLSKGAALGLWTGQGMAAILTGERADKAALPLERALAAIGAEDENWDMRAALWWCLLIAERFGTVEAALKPARARVDRCGTSRGLVAVYSTLGLLRFRLGALPEADAAARIALAVAREGDFAQGLAFGATVLADVAVASGALDEAQALLDLLPRGKLPASVHNVLISAARGRLALAQGRAVEAVAEFEACIAMWDPKVWGMGLRETGYLHARSGAAQALLALGDARRARELAEAELADVRAFRGKRALGVSLRVAGLARGGAEGLAALEESVAVLSESPAVLERAQSLAEWGAAMRRDGARADARRVLAQALDLAARCGARPLIAYAREELRVAGARPRRDWTHGVEGLTPCELRIVRLARDGRTNRQIAQDPRVAELISRYFTMEGATSASGSDRRWRRTCRCRR